MRTAPFIESEFNFAGFRSKSLREPILFDSSTLRPGANGLCCAVLECTTCRYQIERLSPNARFICKHHPRQDHVKALQTYVPERRDYDSTKDRQDAQVHFQKHLLHAAQRVNTSASLRWLVEPKSPPEFLEPTPEELERLRAASAEYDRRVQESYLRTRQIVSSYGNHEQRFLLEQYSRNPSAARLKKRNPLLPGSRVDRDQKLHNRIHIVEFQDRPTVEQKRDWNQRVREAMRQDYLRAREQADLTLHGYIAELQKELRHTDDPVHRAELRQRIIELLLVDPFHLPEPKTSPEINWIETEFGDRGMTRFRPLPYKDGEDLDVFELIPDDQILPKSQKKRVRLTLERITKTYIEHTTKARKKRIEKLIQQGDPHKLRESKDFKKLLADVLVLNDELEPWQVALVASENPETVKKSALRLHKAALALQETEMSGVA
jgi:hypothetical protein